MLTKFWESFAGRMLERWTPRLLTAALGFWLGGLVAWLWSRPGDFGSAVRSLGGRIGKLPVSQQMALLISVLLVLLTSALMSERLALPLLRLLEGYWPRRLAGPLVRRNLRKRAQAMDLAQRLARHADEDGGLPAEARAQLQEVEALLRRLPAEAHLMMPTRLGNQLRTAEERPRERFGLDAIVCWPYLWLLIDDLARDELTVARGALNDATRSWLWAALFGVWTFWAWWAFPAAVVACALIYHLNLLRAAETYGQLLEATYALNRHKLYDALRLESPDPTDESPSGRALTAYLWRGIAAPGMRFRQNASLQGES
ncbi:hypothetical protein ACRYCC_31400 [Actinomadura scrupuli]|uniref:hypothetical protein n=1 Tax=Actinomadura scrupuli TaxID=559629 RepID=UPI003D962431